VDALSFWTFSDVFEESGPIPAPFIGEFGLRAKGGINKPSFYDFALLHKLGATRLSNSNPNIIVTKRSDGSLSIALWNLVDPDKEGGTRQFRLTFQNVSPNASVSISTVDYDHGNVLPVYKGLGSPQYPTEEQVGKMNDATALPEPKHLQLTTSHLDVELPPNALALLIVSNRSE
jgi:xylan 1,4-beta-xylosidase